MNNVHIKIGNVLLVLIVISIWISLIFISDVLMNNQVRTEKLEIYKMKVELSTWKTQKDYLPPPELDDSPSPDIRYDEIIIIPGIHQSERMLDNGTF